MTPQSLKSRASLSRRFTANPKLPTPIAFIWRLAAVQKLGRGFAWFDAGTHHSLLQSSEFIYTIGERQGLKIGCPEEVAYRMGFIDAPMLQRPVRPIADSDYGAYLSRILNSPS
jgi:dTDP-glucose pyrophosphorylase